MEALPYVGIKAKIESVTILEIHQVIVEGIYIKGATFSLKER